MRSHHLLVPRRRAARLVTAALTLAIAVSTTLAGSASAIAASGPRLLSFRGTIDLVAVEGSSGIGTSADLGGAAGGLDVEPIVTVDGVRFTVPADTDDGALAASVLADGVRTGDAVDVTVTVELGVTTNQALDALDRGAASASVVSIAPVQDTPAVPGAELAPASRTSVLGHHTLTVLPIYWGSRDAATQSSLAAFAASTATYWSEQSGGDLTVATSSRDWVQITDPGGCDVAKLLTAALDAHGVSEPTGNDHVAVYFPHRTDCTGWDGRATIRGGAIWVNGTQVVDILAHEFGHNLGIGHANTASCAADGVAVALSGECVVHEYMDSADVMGYAWRDTASGNLNTAFADFLGMATVVPVTTLPAVVNVSRLADVSSGRALKFATTYGTIYVDFRPCQGRDTRMPAWAGVQVHRIVTTNGYPQTQLLDMQPSLASEFSSPELPVNGAWPIPGSGAVIQVTALSATQASITLRSPVTLGSDLEFVPMTPTRVLDTRVTGVPLVAQAQQDVVVAGTSGVPVIARAVAVNLTAVGATAATHLRAWPTGLPRPSSSVLNTDPSRTVATSVMLGVGAANAITVYNNAGMVDIIVDITGYYVATGGQRYTSLAVPGRVLDTRSGPILQSGTTRTVTVAGTNSVPVDAKGVIVNVTSVDSAGEGYVVAHAAGSAMPDASTVNHLPGGNVSNRAVVQLANKGLAVTVQGSAAHVVVDVVGWFGPGGASRFTPIEPERAFDTRTGGGPIGPGATRAFAVSSVVGAPVDASTAVMIVTATQVTAVGTYATAWSGAAVRPGTSDLNVNRDRDQSNLTVVCWGPYGDVSLYNNQGTVHLIGDVYGYFR